MCHRSVLQWVPTVLTADVVRGRQVLEVGAYNVNGSVRPTVEAHGPASYLGVDAQAGPGVDMVCPCDRLVADLGTGNYDIVIATELLEHVVYWPDAVAALVEMVAPGGLLVVTTRSEGFPYHPFPGDHWRFSYPAMLAILSAAGLTLGAARTDPEAPGVFASATKPQSWTPPWRTADAGCPASVLPSAGVTVMPQPAAVRRS